MKTQRRVLLSLLWIQIYYELRTSQGEPEETSTSQQNLERKKVGGDDGGRENMSLLGCVHCEDGNKRKMPSIWK